MGMWDWFKGKEGDKLRDPNATRIVVQRVDPDGGTNDDHQRQIHFERLYDYLIGDQSAIRRHTERAMVRGGLFSSSTVSKMPKPYYNIVQRVISRLCLAYKTNPVRYVVVPFDDVDEGTGEAIRNQKAVRDDMNAQEMWKRSNVNVKAKEWHKMAKLLDTAYVQVVWRNESLQFEIYPPHQVEVIEDDDDYMEPYSVAYRVKNAKGEVIRHVWSDEEYHAYDEQGNEVVTSLDWGGVNKYGILPFVPCRLRETDSHFGEGDTQLVDINEHINVQLASLFFNSIMQAHGQPVAINMDLQGEVQIGPDKAITGKGVPGDASPQFFFAQPNPALEGVMGVIDWATKTAAMMRGLPASALSTEESAISGASKAIDNWELMEIRENDIEYLREFERRLFDVCRAVWNYHVPASQKISDAAQFGIDFPKPEAPVSKDEEMRYKDWMLEKGLWTPVDDMIDEMQGIDKEAAMKLLRDNMELRNELKDEFGILSPPKEIADEESTIADNESLDSTE